MITAVFILALVHGSLVLLCWARWRTISIPDGPAPQDLSVLIATRNNATQLKGLLSSLAPLAEEVIVIDDRSEDDTQDVIDRMVHEHANIIPVDIGDGSGKKDAIAAGVNIATKTHLQCFDDDVQVRSGHLRSLSTYLKGSTADMIILPIRVHSDRYFLQDLQLLEQAGLLGVANATANMGRPQLVNGANYVFRKRSFELVGGFRGNEEWASGDDQFLLEKFKKAGQRIEHLADRRLIVQVGPEKSWADFIRQRLRWAGKMRGVLSPLHALIALSFLFLPWALIWSSIRSMVIHGEVVHVLLWAAWLCWILPQVLLVARVLHFLERPRHALRILTAVIAFGLYAPMIAVLSIFVRPQWKGRKT